MRKAFEYDTLHADDYTVVGMALESVPLIVVNEEAVERRADALMQERIEASRKGRA